MTERSKSVRQAKFMREQSVDPLPEGVPRRIDPEVARRFHGNDVRDGTFFLPNGELRPEYREGDER